MQAILRKGKAFLTPRGSSASLHANGFRTEKSATGLFAVTDPAVDGEDCLHDCASCTVHLPRKWSIDEEDSLYGHVNGWETHLVVATGKNDWVRDVTDEKGSLMQAVGKIGLEMKNGKVMLSASDMPVDVAGVGGSVGYGSNGQTRCLVLPRWEMVEGVGNNEAKWLMEEMIGKGVHNSSPLDGQTNKDKPQPLNGELVFQKELVAEPEAEHEDDGTEMPEISDLSTRRQSETAENKPTSLQTISCGLKPPSVTIKPCPHRAVILMCSHGTRDWRCGKSAPLLRKEFERHLRPLGLYRDVHDERPGGVGVYFINHVGGHKYSANVMIYRREGRSKGNSDGVVDDTSLSSEAVQGIWLARVRPEDCENIVKYTVLEGKLVKPQRQLRGGFDRERGLVSW